MADLFLFIGLPYLALFLLVVGSFIRFRMRQFSYSSLSTQFLENKWLAWSSMPWHIGIAVVLTGHLLAFALPGVWSSLVSYPVFLFTIETIGLCCAILCLISLLLLLVRRLVDAKLQAVTTYFDVIALLVLIAQISTGLSVAVMHRWGAAWAPGALGPYLSGILTFSPNMGYVQEMPPFVKIHIAGAWVLLALFPFTRLVHALVIPLHYFVRSPQKVVWNNTRSQARFEQHQQEDHERRLFLQATIGIGSSAMLLSLGAFDKFFKYFLKQDLTPAEESHVLSQKLERLKQSAAERELELERLNNESIYVAKLSELSATKGKYFIDYQMRPALAFVDEKGYPLLISAKCTHLGCTVGSDLDAQGQVLCPCHISYFNIKTGEPGMGSPAKAPLERLGWVIKDGAGKELVIQQPDGRREGVVDAGLLPNLSLFILKRF